MGNIVLLDDLTINKIAAGEVIERPSSVVKEMVENSIDAGAKNITVEIKNGGISMIKITDDGIGIAEDDMEIAFERHATSKIRRAEDLARVTSMGFRGEALASIAAIARVEMISRNENESVAHKIVVEGGKTIEFTETARNIGTTITVENLFFNTPVRYKFLKKDYTEAGYIEDVVTRIALVNLDISFKLISNGKTIVQTNGNGDIKTAIYSIYGKDISLETVEVDYEFEEIRVRGVVGNPVIARNNRSNQLFFLNGRYIKDKNITAAVDQAFKGIVPVGRYGFAVLNLQMDPKCVDVNVHPAKLEVRFEDESKVFKAVYHAIKSCLTTVNNTKDQMQDTFDFMNSFYQNKVKESFKSGNTTPINMHSPKYEYNYASPIIDNNINGKNNINDKFEFNGKKEEKKSSGIVGLFKKIIKEPEETEAEKNNNYLEDIYKSNYGLGEGTEITIKDNVLNNNVLGENKENNLSSITNNFDLGTSNTLKDNTSISGSINGNKFDESSNRNNIANSNILNKSVVLGGTLISNETMEINIAEYEKNKDNESFSSKIVNNVSNNGNNIDNSDSNNLFKNETNSNTIDSNSDANNIVNDSKNTAFENEFKSNLINNVLDNTQEIYINENTNINTNVNNNTHETQSDKEQTIDIVENINNTGDTQEIYIENSNNSDIVQEDITNNIGEDKISDYENVDIDKTINILESSIQNEIKTENIVDDTDKKIDSKFSDDTNEYKTNNNSITDEGLNTENTNSDVNNYKLDNQNEFDNVASNIIEAKMDLDSTQMIDTDKVRKALNEDIGESTPEFEEMYKKTFGIETFSQRKEKELENIEKQKNDMSNDFEYAYSPALNVFNNDENYRIPYKYVGIAFDNYIIIELKDEIYIINQTNANGRIIYEELSENYYKNDEKVDENQYLLLPDVIALTDKELIVARENEKMLSKAGFIFEEFGDKTIKLVSVPGICEKLNTKQLFMDILKELDKVAITAKEEKADKFIETIAEKVSKRSNQRLDDEKAKELIDQLLLTKNPFDNLLGKPIAIKMTRADLEKKFSRR